MEQNTTDTLHADGYFAVIPERILYANISANAVRCFAILQRYANSENTCWPGQGLIANKMRCSKDTVKRALKELVDIKAITVKRRYTTSGDPTSNEYIIHMGVGAPLHPPPSTTAPTVGAPMPPKTKKDNQSQEQTNTTSSNDDGFTDFWNQYPRKIGKQAAHKAYKNALKHTTHQTIITAIHQYKLHTQTKDPQYIAHPTTWLNQHRWHDQHTTTPTQQPPQPPPTYCGNCYHGWIETTNKRGNTQATRCPCTGGSK